MIHSVRISRPLHRSVATSAVVSLLAPALLFSQPARTARPAANKATVDMSALAGSATVARAMSALQADNEWTLGQQIALCEIPAPPFKEAARAEAYRKQLISLGAINVRIDKEGNVLGEIHGATPGPTVMLTSHLDTVFPEGTDVMVKRNGTKLTAPGIGDDCRGLAVTLAITRQIITQKIPIAGRLLVVATVGEEGPGNLRGVRAIFGSAMRDSMDYFISVDGVGYSITNRAVGSNRYRVKYVGPGGHSYGAFGMPNPIHALGRAIALASDIEVPVNPKVTFNIGIVSGGQSVNSISASGSMDVDMRSESAPALADLDRRMQAAFRKALADEIARWPGSKVPLTLQIDTIGIRPAGATADDAFIVRTALAAGKTMGVYTPLTPSSTDANIPISLGIPAITIDGGGVGQGGHSLDEWYDDRTDGYKGAQWVLLFVLGLHGVTGVR
ncbi:MAG: M20/M25/M40 family metallo-hydrolase [Phycisphaerae bacterium]|nr:M20/M25/M40 family metallo-hydrolase [Gemmatimonadaceae bacterium]